LSLRRRFALTLVSFALLLTAVGGWASLRLASDALNAEMDDKFEQVMGAGVSLGGLEQGNLFSTFTPGEEEDRTWTAYQNRLRSLDEFVAGSWIFRADDLKAIMSSRPVSEVRIGTELSEFAAFRSEVARADSLGVVTTSPLWFGVDKQPYKYGFLGLGEANSGVVLAVRMRADYLIPLQKLRTRIFVAAAAAALLAMVLSGILASTVAIPLERLSRAALKIQRGRWSEPVRQERGREIGRLSKAMERMRSGILNRDEQLRLMLAQVAHEIRNPLGGLELFASAAQESDDRVERNRILGRVRDEVEALNHIISDFLEFARPPEPVPRLHDACLPVREASELVSMEVGQNGKSVELVLPQEPLVVSADPAHVKRVTLNLARNASQAGDHVRVAADLYRGEVRISVSDDGPGVPEELRERIFEPFVTDKEQGAGLGLAIVRKVAEANGGRVELVDPADENHVGEGAEFRVYFKSSDELPAPAHLDQL
jgi:signal transduction histidine kinase